MALHNMHTRRSKPKRQTTGKKQTGVAIITALLIVTIAATVSITISTQLQLDVRRTGNMIALDQAEIYASFIEQFTQDRLQNADNFADLMTELRESGQFTANYPVENGTVEGQITDLNSCLNLNSLVNASLPPPSTDTLVQARLTRLLNNHNVPTTIIPAIIDWIDPDSNTTSPPNGGEDGHYLNLEQPYHTANQPLSSITEVRLIKGAENAQSTPSYTPYGNILKLSEAFGENGEHGPSLCAFSTDDNIPLINVNTASRAVLASLSETMTTAIADDIITCRGENGAEFTKIEDFTSCGNVSTIIKETDLEQLTFSSDYFLLKTRVQVGDANKTTYSIIFRDAEGKTKIISRTQRTL